MNNKLRLRRLGCTHDEGDEHDCGTVEAVNKLIPQAERLAHESCLRSGKATIGGFFAREFMSAMDLLAINAGLRKIVQGERR